MLLGVYKQIPAQEKAVSGTVGAYLPTSVLLEQTQAGNSGVQHSATCMQTTGSPLMWRLLCFELACHMPEHGVLDSNAFQQSFFKQLHVAVVAESSAHSP
jgi:hypothetical protein